MVASGNEVGKISIRVVPDITGFRSEVERELEAIEQSLRGEIGFGADTSEMRSDIQRAVNSLPEAQVGIDADTSGVRSEVASETSGMEATLEIDAELDRRGLLEQARRLSKNLQATVELTSDGKKLRREIESQLTAVKQQLRSIPIGVELDRDSAAAFAGEIGAIERLIEDEGVALGLRVDTRAVADARRSIKDFLDDAKVKLDLDDSAFKSKLAGVRAELTGLWRGLSGKAGTVTVPVDVDVNVDQNRVQRSFSDVLSKLKIPSFNFSGGDDAAGPLNNVSKASAGASNSFLGLTRMGWLVVGVFVAMAPAIGLVAGLLAGLPSLIMAFSAGIGTIALGMDGIKKAATEAGLFGDSNGEGKGGGQLGAALQDLKAQVSDTFYNGLKPAFQQIADMVPQLTSGFTDIASGLSSMFGGIVNAINPAQLSGMFSDIGQFFTTLTPTVGQLTSAFLTLGSAGAEAFNFLVVPLQNFATGFNDVVQRVTQNGVFDQAMSGMSATLNGFFTMFNSLFESGLVAIGQLGPSLENMFSGFGNLLSAAMPALTAFSAGVADTIGNLGNSLAPGFAALAPVISAIMPIITQLATVLGTTLSQAVAAVAPALTQIVQLLGPVLVGAVTALAPVLTQVATTLGTVLLAAVQALAPIMPQLTQTFVLLAAAVGEGLAQFLPVLAQAFAQLLPVIVQLIPVGLQLVQALIPLIPTFAAVATAVVQVVAAFAPLLNILAQVVAFVGQVIAVFAGLAAAIVGKVAELAAGVISGFAGMISSVLAAIGDFVSQAVAKFTEFGSQAVSAVKGFAGQMAAAGADLIRGLINGIGSMMGAAIAKAREVASGVANAVKGFLGINSPSKLFTEYGEFTMEGFANGLDSGGDGAIKVVKAIAKAVMEAMKEVFGIGLNMDVSANGVDSLAASTASGLSAVNKQATQATASVQSFGDSLSAVPTAPLNDLMQSQGGLSAEDSKAQKDELSRQLDLLEIERKQLELQKGQAGANRDAIKARLEEIKQQKLQLGLQRDQLDYANKYGDQVDASGSKMDEAYKDLTKKALNMPVDFGRTVASQFGQDLGVSGGGLLGAITDYGLQFGSQFVFNVSNIDEAMAVQKNQVNKKGMGVVGR